MAVIIKGWGRVLRIPLPALPGRLKPPEPGHGVAGDLTQRAHPAGGSVANTSRGALGVGQDWTPAKYGEYYATSVPVYAAIKIRADAAARVPLLVYFETEKDGEMVREQVPPEHPARKLLQTVNPHWTRSDLWRATETYFNLWGSEYWALARPSPGRPPTEIWPLRADRVRVVTNAEEYIKGYVFVGADGKPIPFLPEDVVRFRNFNPLDEFAGISPMAPVRQSVDLGGDALRGNRTAVANDSTPGLVMETADTMTDPEVAEFYERWEERFRGPNKTMRPALLSGGMKPSSMGFTPKDMQHLQSLLWSLQDVSRAYGVPPPLLADLSRATYANVEAARKMFWESTMVPQLSYCAEVVQEFLIDPNWNKSDNLRTRVVVAFDFSQVEALSENADAKALRHIRYLQNGAMTPNEVRADLGLVDSDQEGADLLAIRSEEEEPGGESPEGQAAVVISQQAPLKALEAGDRDTQPSPRILLMPKGKGKGPKQTHSLPHPDDALRASVLFRTNLEQAEGRYFRTLQQLFNTQTKDLIRNLQAFRSAHPLWGERTIIKALLEELEQVALFREMQQGTLLREEGNEILPTAAQVFDAGSYEEEWAAATRPLVEDAMVAAGRSQVLQFQLGIDFQGQNPITQRWLDSRSTWWARTVNETTGDLVMRQVKLANEAGEGIQELTERLAKLGIDNAEMRAPTIARTEMVVAQNQGHLDAYEEAEVEGKQWLSHNDGRQRAGHWAIHEQVRRVKASFRLGNGVYLIAPGQSGIASEDINCRDVTIPILQVDEES